jgi:hypothetical protein
MSRLVTFVAAVYNQRESTSTSLTLYHSCSLSSNYGVLPSRLLRMTHSNGRYRAYVLSLQSQLSCPTGYFRQIQQASKLVHLSIGNPGTNIFPRPSQFAPDGETVR